MHYLSAIYVLYNNNDSGPLVQLLFCSIYPTTFNALHLIEYEDLGPSFLLIALLKIFFISIISSMLLGSKLDCNVNIFGTVID